MALDDARLKELADELDRIGGSVPSPRNRQIGRIAAELRGEQVTPTPNEARQAERLQAQAEQAQATAEAAQAAAQAAQAATASTAASTPEAAAAGAPVTQAAEARKARGDSTPG